MQNDLNEGSRKSIKQKANLQKSPDKMPGLQIRNKYLRKSCKHNWRAIL